MTKDQFRGVVGASIALTVVSSIALFVLAPALPEELDRWVTQQTDAGLGAVEWLMIAVAIPYLAATVGLFFFARWSRALYAACVVILVIAGLFTGPSVATAWESLCRDLTNLVDGLILGLAYFSDIKHHFAARPEGQS